MRQNIVVVRIQCLLVYVVHHTGRLAPDHGDKKKKKKEEEEEE